MYKECKYPSVRFRDILFITNVITSRQETDRRNQVHNQQHDWRQTKFVIYGINRNRPSDVAMLSYARLRKGRCRSAQIRLSTIILSADQLYCDWSFSSCVSSVNVFLL